MTEEGEYCGECGILLDDKAVTCPEEDCRLCGEECLAEHLRHRLDDSDETRRQAHQRNLYRLLHLVENFRKEGGLI